MKKVDLLTTQLFQARHVFDWSYLEIKHTIKPQCIQSPKPKQLCQKFVGE